MLHIITINSVEDEQKLYKYYKDCGFLWTEWNELCHPDRPYTILFIKTFLDNESINSIFQRIHKHEGNKQVTIYGKMNNPYLEAHFYAGNTKNLKWRHVNESNS
jgi:hypothetical protein